MAALHSALSTLSPTPFSSVPKDETQVKDFLQEAFAKAQVIIDSVPLPPADDSLTAARSRSDTTTSTASCASEISISSARSEPLDPSNAVFQKEWGKPIKLSAKDNPLGMAVYKLGAKDSRGAWFARRSVHEGLGFRKWKLGLQKEFPETLEVQGGPGEGNIRGIGGERRIERMAVDEDLGMIEVYHLSAQFPGPTTPRDFVTLLITSSSAFGDPEAVSRKSSGTSSFKRLPRHFMVISRPCQHSDCPPRDGFIRGSYESVEFIREIPRRPKRASSSTDLLNYSKQGRGTSPSIEKAALMRSTQQRLNGEGSGSDHPGDNNINGHVLAASVDESLLEEGRKRGRTISFAGSRGAKAKGEAMDTHADIDDTAEDNPVEWILVTRSDPGGSVPRFMVERGTPSGIVTDASKFLDWACKKEHSDEDDEALNDGDLKAYQTDGHLAGLGGDGSYEKPSPSLSMADESTLQPNPEAPYRVQQGLVSSVTNAAYASIESYAPQILIDHLPLRPSSASSGFQNPQEVTALPNGGIKDTEETSSITSSSTLASFASAEDHFEDDTQSTKSINSTSASTSNNKDSSSSSGMTVHEKELAKLNSRKKALDDKLAKTRERELKDKEELTSKEEERLRRANEKHAKEIAKQEEKYKNEVAKLEAKRLRDVAKEEERRKKLQDKDEKTRLTREKENVRQELEVVAKERDILREQVGALQRENTALVARMGKMEEIKAEVEKGEDGGRSRSSSLRIGKGQGDGVDATLLGGKKE